MGGVLDKLGFSDYVGATEQKYVVGDDPESIAEYGIKDPVGVALLFGSDCTPTHSEENRLKCVSMDLARIDGALKVCGFTVINPYRNVKGEVTLTYRVIENHIAALLRDPCLDEYSSFLFYFSGHGVSRGILLSETDPEIPDGVLTYRKIAETVSNIPATHGRPKIFIFDCCRTALDKEDSESVEVKRGGQSDFSADTESKYENEKVPEVYPPPDSVLCFAVTDGQMARGCESGSLYTTRLANALQKCHKKFSFSDIVHEAHGKLKESVRHLDEPLKLQPMMKDAMNGRLILYAETSGRDEELHVPMDTTPPPGLRETGLVGVSKEKHVDAKRPNRITVYNIKKPVGVAILFGSHCTPVSFRANCLKCVRMDLERIDVALAVCGFKVMNPCLDAGDEVTLTHRVYEKTIDDLCHDPLLGEYSTFLFYFSGHGVSRGILLSETDDNNPDDEIRSGVLSYKKIAQKISSIPETHGRPKIFIFDCCRTPSDWEDCESVEVKDGGKNMFSIDTQKVLKAQKDQVYPPPDSILCFAVTDNQESRGDTGNGSWYTVYFSNVLQNLYATISFSEIVHETHARLKEWVKAWVDSKKKHEKIQLQPFVEDALNGRLVLYAETSGRDEELHVPMDTIPPPGMGEFEVHCKRKGKTSPGEENTGTNRFSLVMTDRVEKSPVYKSKAEVQANLTKLGEGVKVFICYAPDPDDPYSDPGEKVAVIDQHEQKIWSLINDLERHGFYVSSDLNMPGAPDSILRWVAARIDLSDYVILVCSPALRELVTASSLSEKVKDVRAKRLFKYSNAIYGVMERQTSNVTKLVSVILDGRYDNLSSAPCMLSSGRIYRLCEVASPRKFDYDCKNGEFEALVCRMAGIDRALSQPQPELPRLPPPSFEEEEHLAAIRDVMAKKGKMEQTIMHCLLFGYPETGKSSLMKRLLGQPPNPILSSTGVAEKAVKVEIHRLTTSTAMALRTTTQHDAVSKWCSLSYDDEAIALMATAARGITHSEEEVGHSGIADSMEQGPGMEASFSASTNVAATMEADPDDSQLNPLLITVPSDMTTELDQSAAEKQIDPMEVLKQALKRTGLAGARQYLQQSLTLYLTDTGGQLEFQELVSALTAGPTLFFVIFRLDQDLDETTSIQFRYPNSDSTKPYQSSITVRESLLQSLASISSMGTYLYITNQEDHTLLKARVIFIGTHCDKVSDEKIKEIDRSLYNDVKATSFYHKGLIERVSESRLLVAVNNLSSDDAHFQRVRSLVERIADKCKSDFRVILPSTWFIFSLMIRQLEKRVITYSYCFAIARQCGIESEGELNEALWFLNTKVGLVRHFRGEGLEDLQDIVIVDPQILFDRITRLIVNTFTDESTTANVCDEFKSKGIFPLSVLKQISSKDNDDKLLTVSRFVKLLEHLHIISPLHTKEFKSDKYFMPCALTHAQSTAPETVTHSTTVQIPPLLITFKCGYCPMGIFSALVVYLLANKMKSKLDWELQTEFIFRNAISLCVGPYDSVTLTQTPLYLEVAMLPIEIEDRKLSVEIVCVEVRLCIEKAVREVTSTLHYTNDCEYTLAYYCTGKHDPEQVCHPAKLVFFQEEPCTIQCELGGKKVKYLLPENYLYWFGKGLPEKSPSKSTPSHWEVFRENLPIIHIGVLSNVQHGLATTAYAQGLISERVHRDVTDALNRLTADERTKIFLNELELQIHNDTNVLPKFVDMLKQADPLHYTSIIRAITEALELL